MSTSVRSLTRKSITVILNVSGSCFLFIFVLVFGLASNFFIFFSQTNNGITKTTTKKMDHAVKTSKTKPWDKLRFENEELECLYQRYTLKMQRFSVIGVVSLFILFCMTMVTLSYAYSSLLTLHVSLFKISLFI